MADDVTPWNLKVQVTCPACDGARGDESGTFCGHCSGRGTVLQEVAVSEISNFLDRPEHKDYQCVCGKRERVLRPRDLQIPVGWVQWNGYLVCSKCKAQIVQAAIQAASWKITDIKEKSWKRSQ